MGESDRYQDYKLSKRRFTLGQPGNALFALLATNLVFFFLILLSRVFYLFTHQGSGNEATAFDALEWFAMPAKLTTLSEKPWTLLTFMFAQGGVQHPFLLLLTMLSTMLWLWVFAYILQDLSGNPFIFPIYIYGSLLGAFFFITAANIIPSARGNIGTTFLYGAQTGAIAIAVAVTTFSPQYRIFRNIGTGIPIWILAVFFVLLSLVRSLPNNIAHCFAVLGSVLAGYLFVRFLRAGRDLSLWMHRLYAWSGNLFNPNAQKGQGRIKEKIFYNTGNRKPFSKTANVTQQRIDEILDKINQQGYHFLSDEEKNILKRAGEEDI
jgi:Rhomboid family